MSTSEILPQNGDPYRGQFSAPDKHKVVMMASDGVSSRDDDEGKYTRRNHPVKRNLQRLFPWLFPLGLPVTSK